MGDRIDRLEQAERDLERVEAERDALAKLVMDICGNPKGVSESGQEELYEAALRGDAIAPATSLARQKAQWQAEALEEFADGANPNNESEDVIVRKAYEAAENLRRQAEELK